jgi:hypothetical protein
MVDTNGNSFSHHEKEANNVYALKEFPKSQSVIHVTFDQDKNKVYFKLANYSKDPKTSLDSLENDRI